MSDLLAPKDLTDRKTLIAECEAVISGMDLQAQAGTGHSAMGGVPNPAYFYGRGAALLRALKARLEAEETAPAPEPKPKRQQP